MMNDKNCTYFKLNENAAGYVQQLPERNQLHERQFRFILDQL